MRKTTLNRVSIMVGVVLVCGALLLALVRTLLISPGEARADEEGSELFRNKGCAHCHFTDSNETKVGPGLAGLFQLDKLPMSGREVTEENVRKQLVNPYENMPSFADRLTEQQIDQIISYLKSL